jgi:hypothetical protein
VGNYLHWNALETRWNLLSASFNSHICPWFQNPERWLNFELYTTSHILIPPPMIPFPSTTLLILMYIPALGVPSGQYVSLNLSLGSQASIRDMSKAYHTIPIALKQWPGLFIKLQEQDAYCINTNNNLRLASAGGVYGEMADAGTDIFRARGIGPISKCVDNHIFFQIPCEYLVLYNAKKNLWGATIANNGRQSQSGSRLWYYGENMPDDLPAEFDEDTSCALRDWSFDSAHSGLDSVFSYCNADIDALSEQLGIPWESSKTIPFSNVVPVLGFQWNISEKTVEITKEKKDKYKSAIEK